MKVKREEILALSPPQLDIQVGEKIRGWHWRRRKKPLGRCTYTWHETAKSPYATSCQCLFNPSGDIAQAWPIAVSMGLGVFPLNNGDWACCKASHLYHLEITRDHYADPNLVICGEAPEAICKMALIAKGRK